VFELNSKSIEAQLENVKDEFKRELEVILRERFQEFPTFILKKFKSILNRAENGLPVDWKKENPETIERKYTKCKE